MFVRDRRDAVSTNIHHTGTEINGTLIPAKAANGVGCLVLKTSLGKLIREGKIQKFRRSSGWLDAGEDPRKENGSEYNEPERRMREVANGALFMLPVEEQLRAGLSVEAVLGYGEKARDIVLDLKTVAITNLSVLILGKTGSGKGLAATILHELSRRKDMPFVKVDCGAIPPTLIESELFGYERGSFTGAFKSKPGRFQMAEGGTIFLDEIANLNMDMQTRLLGFLEERVVNSIGGVNSVRLDVRVISATNVDLIDQIRAHRFREDLFYRLNEFEIYMPTLRERSDDMFYLATKFLSMANVELGKNVVGFSEEAIDFFARHEWSGNIRELKNVIKRAVLFADDVIQVGHLLGNGREGKTATSFDGLLENGFVKGLSLHEINDKIRKIAETRVIQRVYMQSGRNKRKTSNVLGIDYSTLYRKMKEYGIE
jgi:transcriptional regulator with PAS, ATPase and Fis domain